MASGKRKVGSSRTPASTSKRRSSSAESQRVSRAPRERSSGGPPPGLIIAGILLGLGIVGWAFMQGANKASTAGNMIFAAEKALSQGMSSTDIEKKLRLAEEDSSISAEQRLRINQLRADLKVRDAQTALDLHNNVGTEYVQKKLRNYTSKYLEGEPDPPKARVFLERAKVFHERWPEHPEMDWVLRQERRFAAVADLSKPPNYADVAWKAESLTYAKPRDYTLAFQALDAFIAGAADDEDKLMGTNLKSRMVAERAEYHEDRMLQAEFEYRENKDEGTAVHWLVHGVIGMGDASMANEAADFLVKMPSAAEYLRGYRSKQPMVFERLIQNPIVKAYAAENGI
jgi:hypothetical protein